MGRPVWLLLGHPQGCTCIDAGQRFAPRAAPATEVAADKNFEFKVEVAPQVKLHKNSVPA